MSVNVDFDDTIRKMTRDEVLQSEVEYLRNRYQLALNHEMKLEKRIMEFIDACRLALGHVSELEDAWERGCISEHDGSGGTRSNRNVAVCVALKAALGDHVPELSPEMIARGYK